MSTNKLPLDGIKVVEFSHMVMGPTAGLILADLGAEVIKIEPLKGDKTRRLKGSGAGYFSMYNRNKQSLCVDLTSEPGKRLAQQIVDGADILIENFRPGAMDKLGFGYQQLSSSNSRLIYCSLKGFLSGPYEKRTALDEVAQMMGGLAYMTGLPDKPMRAGSSVIDIAGGMFGVIGILSALERRHTTGKGEMVTSSLFETSAFMVGQHMAQQTVSGDSVQPMSVRQSAWSVYDTFQTLEGEGIFVGIVSDTQWRSFCEEFGLDAFASNPALEANNSRVAERETIIPIINQLFLTMSNEELSSRLERIGIPFSPINSPADLFNDPHLNTNDGLLEITISDGKRAGTKTKLPALPIEIGARRLPLRSDLPKEGEQGIDIMRKLGYTDDAIAQQIAGGWVRVNDHLSRLKT
jgi:crotonobetainyl-CoA:carnitine CoA-transferase CaiB-like acyl-CoA transferase